MIFIITIAIVLLIFIINLWIQLHHQDHPQMIIFLMARCWQWKREEISRCHVCWPVLAILRSYHNIIVQYYNITVNILISFFSIIYQRILTSPPQRKYSLPMSSHYHFSESSLITVVCFFNLSVITIINSVIMITTKTNNQANEFIWLRDDVRMKNESLQQVITICWSTSVLWQVALLNIFEDGQFMIT